MTKATDAQVDVALATAGVGGANITLRSIGTIAGMNLYVDLGQQDNPKVAYDLAVKVLFKAFITKVKE